MKKIMMVMVVALGTLGCYEANPVPPENAKKLAESWKNTNERIEELNQNLERLPSPPPANQFDECQQKK